MQAVGIAGRRAASVARRVGNMVPSERYIAALRTAAERAHGRVLGAGTTFVVDPERAGSGSASCYPTPHGSIVWCDAGVIERVSTIDVSGALSAVEFVHATTALGGVVVGFGHLRTLDGALRSPDVRSDGMTVRHFGVGEDPPVELLGALSAACEDDDVGAADLDLECLDPTYTLVIAPDGTIVAYASARPLAIDPSFDDIAVLTHPDWRGRRLGAFAVHEFIRRRSAEGQSMLYRCNVDNVASSRLAESLGFSLVTTIGAVSLANASGLSSP